MANLHATSHIQNRCTQLKANIVKDKKEKKKSEKKEKEQKEKIIDTELSEEIDIVEYYNGLLGQMQYEGSGLWNRFNIMLGLNVSLFGLGAFVFSSDNIYKYKFLVLLSFIGLFYSIWSLFVLRKLWMWHYRWADVLREIEIILPAKLPKPFTGSTKLKRKVTNFHLWVKAYTQPFFWVIGIVWIILLTYNISNFNTVVEAKPTYILKTEQQK